MKEEEESTFVEFLHRPQNAILCSPRVTLLAYISRNNSFFHSNYPINILRNIGIRHTRTSHFLVLDTDMWVSQTSYEMLMKIPDSIWESPQIAVVIPAFFSLQWNLPQLPLEQQILSYRVPLTMDDLRRCKKEKKCIENKPKLFTHVALDEMVENSSTLAVNG